MPNPNNNQRSGSGLKTAATFGIGAIVGALAAGAAWYFSSDEEQSQRQVYSSNHPANQHTPSSPAPQHNDTDEKDEKDGTITMCEICFVSFAELKECGVQIVSTPCGHLYCRDCIIGALAAKPECPHCRGEVSDRTLRRIYL